MSGNATTQVPGDLSCIQRVSLPSTQQQGSFVLSAIRCGGSPSTARRGRVEKILLRSLKAESACGQSCIDLLRVGTGRRHGIWHDYENLTAWCQWPATRQGNFLMLSAASRALLDPLLPPGRGLEGIREILCLVDDLAVAELHNTHGVCRPPLVRDGVFRDPEIPVSENALDLEAGRLTGVMTPQGLQIASSEDALARLRIITNSIVIVNVVFRIGIAGCRCLPMRIQGRADLFLLHGLLLLRFRLHIHLPCETAAFCI
jgi:hypothetical protein